MTRWTRLRTRVVLAVTVLALLGTGCIRSVESLSGSGRRLGPTTAELTFGDIRYTYWSFLCDARTAGGAIQLTYFRDGQPAGGGVATNGTTFRIFQAPEEAVQYTLEASIFGVLDPDSCGEGEGPPVCQVASASVPACGVNCGDPEDTPNNDGSENGPPPGSPEECGPGGCPQKLPPLPDPPPPGGPFNPPYPSGPSGPSPSPGGPPTENSPQRPPEYAPASSRGPSSDSRGLEGGVLPATGEVLVEEFDTEYRSPTMPFQGLRTYRSNKSTQEGSFGAGWHFVYDQRVRFEGGWAYETDGAGTTRLYERFDDDPDFEPNRFTAAQASFVGDLGDGTYQDFVVEYPDASQFVYDVASGYLREIRDESGQALSVGRNAAGHLASVTDTAGRVTSFQADASGHVTSMTIPSGETWSYEYQGQNLVSVKDPVGNQQLYGYDLAGKLSSRTNAAGLVRSWQYDAEGRAIQATSELGRVASYSYEPPSIEGARGDVVYDDGRNGTLRLTMDYQGQMVRAVESGTFSGTSTSSADLTWTYTWDGTGRLLAKTDPVGNGWTYTYDSTTKRLKSATDPRGKTHEWLYDPNRSILSGRTNVDGTSTQQTWDASGLLASMTNELGQTTTFTSTDGLYTSATDATGATWSFGYDGAGNRTSIRDPLGRTSTATYDAIGRVISVTDPLARTTSFTYYLHDLVATVTDPLGQVRRIEYDAQNRPVRFVDVDGAVTTRTYLTLDGRHFVATETNPVGETWSYEYDDEGVRIAVVDPRGARRETVPDNLGQPFQRIDSVGDVTVYEWLPDRLLAVRRDSNGAEMRYEYDALRRLVRSSNAVGAVLQREYDDRSRLTRFTDAEDNSWGYEYDAAGRLSEVTDPLGHSQQFTYTARGERETVTDELGRTWTYEYDAAGQLVRSVDPLGGEVVRTYDAAGQLVALRDEEGRVTAFEYDALGRRTKVTAPDGGVTTLAYTSDGLLSSSTDANGHTRSYLYDAADRLVSESDALGHTRSYTYDASGNQTSVTDENGNTTSFEYDSENRQTAVVDALGRRVERVYDSLGRLAQETNSRGQVTLFEYDLIGRLVQKATQEDVESSSYDLEDRRLSSMNSAFVELFEYDGVGRLVAEVDLRGFQSRWTYDPAGNPTARQDSRGRSAITSYDDLNRPVRYATARGGLYAYEYDRSGRPTRMTYPAGEVEARAYGTAGRLVRQELRTEDAGPVFHAVDYVYDLGGNLTSRTDTFADGEAVQTSYTYNDRDELTRAEVVTPGGAAKMGWTRIDYAHDPAGNRTSRTIDGVTETYSYNQLNQPISRNGAPFVFDEDGNMLREPLPGGSIRVNSYDSESNLVQTALETVAGLEDVFGYFYDPDGRVLQIEEGPDASDPVKPTTILERFWSRGRVVEEAKRGATETLEEAAWTVFSGLGFEIQEIEIGAISPTGVFDSLGFEQLFVDRLGTPVITQRQGARDFDLRLVSQDVGGVEGRLIAGSNVDGDGSEAIFSGVIDSFSRFTRVYVKDLETGALERIPIADRGGQIRRRTASNPLTMSADARYVTFGSSSEDVLPESIQGERQFYRYDRTTGVTELITRTITGTVLLGLSGTATLTMAGDGQRIVFEANTSDLVTTPVGNGVGHLYLWDQGVISAVDVKGDGTFPNDDSLSPALASDGQAVAFVFTGTDLVPGITTTANQVYVKDMATGAIELVSSRPDGTPSSAGVDEPAINGDGSLVAFTGIARDTGLIPVSGDPAAHRQIYLKDRTTGALELISVSTAGAAGRQNSRDPSISDDGRFVTFISRADNFRPEDIDGLECVFIRDRLTGVTTGYDVPTDTQYVNFMNILESNISGDGTHIVFRTSLTVPELGIENSTQVWRIRNPLSPSFSEVTREFVSRTPYGEQKAGPDDVGVGLHGLREEVRGDASPGASDTSLVTPARTARVGLGRWGSRDPAGMVDGPNLFRFNRNNPLRWSDRSGLNPLNACSQDPHGCFDPYLAAEARRQQAQSGPQEGEPSSGPSGGMPDLGGYSLGDLEGLSTEVLLGMGISMAAITAFGLGGTGAAGAATAGSLPGGVPHGGPPDPPDHSDPGCGPRDDCGPPSDEGSTPEVGGERVRSYGPPEAFGQNCIFGPGRIPIQYPDENGRFDPFLGGAPEGHFPSSANSQDFDLLGSDDVRSLRTSSGGRYGEISLPQGRDHIDVGPLSGRNAGPVHNQIWNFGEYFMGMFE